MLRSASPSAAPPNSGGSSCDSDLPNPMRTTNSFAYVKLGSGCPPPKSSCIQESHPQIKSKSLLYNSEYLKLISGIIHKRIRPLVYSSVKSFLVPQVHPQKYALHKLQRLHVMHHNFNKRLQKFTIMFWDEEKNKK